MISPELLQLVIAGYRLPLGGVHGVLHWARVLENGRRLAPATGADIAVVELFAVFHDAERNNEGLDPWHGDRAANLARTLLSADGGLDSARLLVLEDACRHHSRGFREADETIRTCWDADRLDLLRVGTVPAGQLLCTDAARDPSVITWANERARKRELPDLVWDEWRVSMTQFGSAW